jgi:hypothetical protein
MNASEFPFTISVCDRRNGSQISVASVRLHHVLFEDSFNELVELLRNLLIYPIGQGAIPLFEIHEQLTHFFSEGGQVEMDGNLSYYDGDELAQILRSFDPTISFTLYYPHNRATRVHVLNDMEQPGTMYQMFRVAQLLH